MCITSTSNLNKPSLGQFAQADQIIGPVLLALSLRTQRAKFENTTGIMSEHNLYKTVNLDGPIINVFVEGMTFALMFVVGHCLELINNPSVWPTKWVIFWLYNPLSDFKH